MITRSFEVYDKQVVSNLNNSGVPYKSLCICPCFMKFDTTAYTRFFISYE